MSWAVIVNPRASKVTEDVVARVTSILPAGAHVHRTTEPLEAVQLTRELDGRVEVIAALGGDGTFNEVLNGAGGVSRLAFLPAGGTSVLPRALGLPRDPVAAARVVARGGARRIGLGRANGRRFGFSCGVGLDAELVRSVDELGREPDGRRPGDAAFARAAVRTIAARRGRFEPALEIERIGRAAFVLVANCDAYTYLGRLRLRVVDGAAFERGLAFAAPVRVTPWALPRLVAHTVRGGRGRGVLTASDVDRIVVRCDAPMAMQLDGEDVGDVEEVVLEAERDAVTVLV